MEMLAAIRLLIIIECVKVHCFETVIYTRVVQHNDCVRLDKIGWCLRRPMTSICLYHSKRGVRGCQPLNFVFLYLSVYHVCTCNLEHVSESRKN